MAVTRGENTDGWGMYDFERSLEVHRKRDECILKYAFAVPGPEALQALVELSPIVEIGAGLGYWAHLLEQMGADVTAYDLHVNKSGKVKLYSEKRYVQPYTTVIRGEPAAAWLHSDRTLFLCWPPYDEPMAFDSLDNYLKGGGQTLAYVGEGSGGCTGDDAFHELMGEKMEHERTVGIPVWWGIHDRLEIWRAK
jgi:hypothetical protein